MMSILVIHVIMATKWCARLDSALPHLSIFIFKTLVGFLFNFKLPQIFNKKQTQLLFPRKHANYNIWGWINFDTLWRKNVCACMCVYGCVCVNIGKCTCKHLCACRCVSVCMSIVFIYIEVHMLVVAFGGQRSTISFLRIYLVCLLIWGHLLTWNLPNKIAWLAMDSLYSPSTTFQVLEL